MQITPSIAYKRCIKCSVITPLDGFYKHKKMKDGHLNKCIVCTKKDSKINHEISGKKYDSSMKGVIRVMYHTQKRHQALRGHGEMPYSKEELSGWLMINGFADFYQEWVDSGLSTEKKPSIDRVDDFKGYSFDNIRLVTWQENREHQHSDIRSGKGTGGLRCKAVIKMDSNFLFLQEFHSYSSAARHIGYSLEYQIKNSKMCRQGFYWKYKED